MIVVVKIETSTGDLAGIITARPKDFKTGSTGFFGTSKIELDGNKYQAQVQLIEIGSSPKAKAKAEALRAGEAALESIGM